MGALMLGSLEAGSRLHFGRWGGEDIEWLVLDVEPSRVLLITDKAIDCKQYHHVYEDVTWSACTLRAWLNGEFLQEAFNPAERDTVLEVNVINDGNPDFGTDGGPDTRDKVFCLSIDETRVYFENMRDRVCHPTPHAKDSGVWTSEKGACDWWLRTPGSSAENAVVVDPDGAIAMSGDGVAGGLDVDFATIIAIETGVRPALWVRK